MGDNGGGEAFADGEEAVDGAGDRSGQIAVVFEGEEADGPEECGEVEAVEACAGGVAALYPAVEEVAEEEFFGGGDHESAAGELHEGEGPAADCGIVGRGGIGGCGRADDEKAAVEFEALGPYPEQADEESGADAPEDGSAGRHSEPAAEDHEGHEQGSGGGGPDGIRSRRRRQGEHQHHPDEIRGYYQRLHGEISTMRSSA